MNHNIIRQIIDIQAQAERLIETNANMVEIEQFAKYNEEIKSFLISNVKDDFVLKYVKEIPDLNLEEEQVNRGLSTLVIILLSSFAGWLAIYNENRKSQNALKNN